MSAETDGQGQAFATRSEIAARTALRLTEAAAATSWRGPDPFDGLWFGWPGRCVRAASDAARRSCRRMSARRSTSDRCIAEGIH